MEDVMFRLPATARRARVPGALLALLLSAAAATIPLSGSPVSTAATPPRVPERPVTCDLRHPIDVRIRPLDAVARGARVRLSVEVSPSMDLERATVRIVSTGGASPAGALQAALGALPAEGRGSAEFALRVPADGRRCVVQMLVTADSPAGPMSRLAMFNLLPDGPADPGRVLTTPGGEGIRQYTAGLRRIGR